MGIKLLHTADLHLDRPLLALGERRTVRRAEMRARFEELLGLARERQVDALLVAGDLFDRPAADSAPWVKGHLGALAAEGIRVYLIPGNHDAHPACPFYAGDFPPGVCVFREPALQANLDLPGTALYGLAYHAAGRHRSPLAGLSLIPGIRWHVALVHGQVRSSGLVGQDYAPLEPAEIAASGLDYLALGHYHGYKDCSAGQTRACYAGSPHRLDFGDTAPRQAVLVELGEEVRVEPIPLADRQFLQIEGEAGRPEKLYEQLVRLDDPGAILRVRLTGRAGTPVAGLAADLRDKFGDKFFSLEVDAAGAATQVPAAQAGTVAHAFARLMAEKLAAAPDPETAELVRLAADYGLLALEGRQLP
ncbi:MAG: metallophosphoesterase family protein [Bacteroidota bacterium]